MAAKKEAQESDVPCHDCGGGCTPGTVVVLQGLARCSDCAMQASLHLRYHASVWKELSRHDQVEALEIIETQAHLERAQLVRRPL